MNLEKTIKDKELLAMMLKFKELDEREKGFVFGLAEGFVICKSKCKNDTNIQK